jgi:serine/threonine-protein kinase
MADAERCPNCGCELPTSALAGAAPRLELLGTLKLVEGRTLADILAGRPDPAADQPRMLGIFVQVCHTVAYAHSRGVIHRDLKSSNVMVGSFGEVNVMDWARAKVLRRDGASDDDDAGKVDVQGTITATARGESNAEHSQAGSEPGTLAYMAPEQARGEIDDLDERVDVFALGSILCQILTGEPAFVSHRSGKTQSMAARGDLADAFARLDACGADAELVALARACLAAERTDRPRDAAAVVSRMSSYRAREQERRRAAEETQRTTETTHGSTELAEVHSPLTAHPVAARAEKAQRTAETTHHAPLTTHHEAALARVAVDRSRRRRMLALAAALLVMTTIGAATFAYIAQARQARAAAVERILGRATTLLEEARAHPEDSTRWRHAGAAVQQLEDAAAGIAPEARDPLAALKSDATSGLFDAERNATLRQALVEVRANQQDAGASATDEAYAEAFRAAGIDLDTLSVTEAADRLKRRPAALVVELAGFLDHWSSVRRASKRPAASWRQPLEVARSADADNYRDQLRALMTGDDLKAAAAPLRDLADEPRADELPAPTAVLLGAALESAGDRPAAVSLLRRAVERHADDVWINFSLATALTRLTPAQPDEAVRYYTAARALRPETAHNLAHLLDEMGRHREAEATFRDLVARRPGNASYLACFTTCLKSRGQTDKAAKHLEGVVAAARAALESKPDDPEAHCDLGNALVKQDKPAEAEAEFRKALKLNPDHALARFALGNALSAQGKPSAAAAEFRAVIKLKPDDSQPRAKLAMALLALGKPSEAESELRAALKLKPGFVGAHTDLGNVLLIERRPVEAEAAYRTALELRPSDPQAHAYLGMALSAQGKPAEAEYRAALKLNPDDAATHYNLANTLRAQGKPDLAEEEYRATLKLNPDLAEAHCNLGHLLRQAGRYAEALDELRRGHALGWRRPGWRYPSAEWVREVERLAALDDRLPAVLSGGDQPANAPDRLTFAQLCTIRKRHAVAARLYAEAFHADPTLTDERQAQYRYSAACAAALAGCGQGEDNPPPDAYARAKLRGQALAWLNSELAAWSKMVDAGNPNGRAAVRQVLEHWKGDPDLAGLRDEAELAKLPADERQAWRALWKGVESF